jgi:hypothetical protein
MMTETIILLLSFKRVEEQRIMMLDVPNLIMMLLIPTVLISKYGFNNALNRDAPSIILYIVSLTNLAGVATFTSDIHFPDSKILIDILGEIAAIFLLSPFYGLVIYGVFFHRRSEESQPTNYTSNSYLKYSLYLISLLIIVLYLIKIPYKVPTTSLLLLLSISIGVVFILAIKEFKFIGLKNIRNDKHLKSEVSNYSFKSCLLISLLSMIIGLVLFLKNIEMSHNISYVAIYMIFIPIIMLSTGIFFLYPFIRTKMSEKLALSTLIISYLPIAVSFLTLILPYIELELKS